MLWTDFGVATELDLADLLYWPRVKLAMSARGQPEKKLSREAS